MEDGRVQYVPHMKKKRRVNRGTVVTFDEDARKEYLTGFHKRKKERRKRAEQQVKEQERAERIRNRKTKRDYIAFVRQQKGGDAATQSLSTLSQPAGGSEQTAGDPSGDETVHKTYESRAEGVLVTTTIRPVAGVAAHGGVAFAPGTKAGASAEGGPPAPKPLKPPQNKSSAGHASSSKSKGASAVKGKIHRSKGRDRSYKDKGTLRARAAAAEAGGRGKKRAGGAASQACTPVGGACKLPNRSAGKGRKRGKKRGRQ